MNTVIEVTILIKSYDKLEIGYVLNDLAHKIAASKAPESHEFKNNFVSVSYQIKGANTNE